MLKETVCIVSMAMGWHTCPNETKLPVTGISRDGLVVCSLHAGTDRGKTHINGKVEKSFGLPVSATTKNHVDIVITQKGKTIQSLRAGLLPSQIPATRQGVPGRSSFGVTLDPLPADAQITVVPHRELPGDGCFR